jgi:hypothetical protein
MIHERSGRNVAKIADGSARCCDAAFAVSGGRGNASCDGLPRVGGAGTVLTAAECQFGIA